MYNRHNRHNRNNWITVITVITVRTYKKQVWINVSFALPAQLALPAHPAYLLRIVICWCILLCMYGTWYQSAREGGA